MAYLKDLIQKLIESQKVMTETQEAIRKIPPFLIEATPFNSSNPEYEWYVYERVSKFSGKWAAFFSSVIPMKNGARTLIHLDLEQSSPVRATCSGGSSYYLSPSSRVQVQEIFGVNLK